MNTFFALASVLGLLLLLQGFFTLTRGIALRDETPYWWLDVIGGGLITLLGIWVSTSDGVWNLAARAAFILLWVGFMAIFRGISDIAVASRSATSPTRTNANRSSSRRRPARE